MALAITISITITISSELLSLWIPFATCFLVVSLTLWAVTAAISPISRILIESAVQLHAASQLKREGRSAAAGARTELGMLGMGGIVPGDGVVDFLQAQTVRHIL